MAPPFLRAAIKELLTKAVAPHPPLTDSYDAPAKREEYVREIFDETAPWYDWATWFLSFGSGDWYAGGFSSGVKFQEWLKLDSRGLFRRGESNLVFQSFHQWTAEAALTIEFAPPFEMLSRNWSVIPFAKYIKTDFDAANPFIDPFTVRADKQWIVGAMFNAPIAKGLGVTATVQYDKVDSNIKNYTQDNFSVMVGPTARF